MRGGARAGFISRVVLRNKHKTKVAIVSIGSRLAEAVTAAREVEAAHPDIAVTVADARFLKPLDAQMLRQLALESDVMVSCHLTHSPTHSSSLTHIR
jgi:1-deoxy-D-xylulose-5-phosphate synthase